MSTEINGTMLEAIAGQLYPRVRTWQAKLATDLNVSQGSVSNWISGTAISKKNQAKIVELLNTVLNPPKSKAELMKDLLKLHRMFNKALDAILYNPKFRALVVYGPAGTGKTHTTLDKVQQANINYHDLHGTGSAFGLYSSLYDIGDGVLIVDDCDQMLDDENTLNILKGALDTNSLGSNRISWNSFKTTNKNAEYPPSFSFEGKVVFLTNIDFRARARTGKLSEHYKAVLDRCFYLDLSGGSDEAGKVWTNHIFKTIMYKQLDLTKAEADEIADYVEGQQEKFTKLNLRTYAKLANAYQSFDKDWRDMADTLIHEPV